jgi:hypothetical protein
MYSVVINNQIFDQIPSSIEEVSISRYINLIKIDRTDIRVVLRWILNAEVQVKIEECSSGPFANVLALALPVLQGIWNFADSLKEQKVPGSIDFFGYEVFITSKFLNGTPDWSYKLAERIVGEELSRELFDPTPRVPQILAHYFYSDVTRSSYNEKAADEFASIVNELSMVPCMKFGRIFFLKLVNLYYLNKEY